MRAIRVKQPRTRRASAKHARRTAPRRGVASAMAMLYLILFSTLALGFYASVTTSAQIAGSEQYASKSLVAAESGMQFVCYLLSQNGVSIPYGTPVDQRFTEVYNDLATKLASYTGYSGTKIARVTTATSDCIFIPPDGPSGDHNWFTLDNLPNSTNPAGRFRAVLVKDGTFITVYAYGRNTNSSVLRCIKLKYDYAQNATNIFNYGVATKGKLVTGGNAIIKGDTDPTKGSILSTVTTDPNPVTIGGKEVSGDISITNPTGVVAYAGAKIGGTTDPFLISTQHIHKGVTAPDFPAVDTTAFAAFATTNIETVSGSTFVNTYIPPNSPKASFAGGTVIKGVLYIKSPNHVSFSGNTTIQGVIVVENGASFDMINNTISFAGSVTATGVETLDNSVDPTGQLRKLTGSFLLAPNFNVSFTGDFGTVGGSIVASKVSMSGSAGGTVRGSVINLDNTTMTLDGSSDVVIASTGTTNYPAGLYFPGHFAPIPGSYEEVVP